MLAQQNSVETGVPIYVVDYACRNFGLSVEKSAEICGEFLAYMDVAKAGQAVPSDDVDRIWHAFVLHTKEYQEFCWRKYGQFVHHVPSRVEEGHCSGQCSAACSTR